jgi:hypothetical protein
MPVVAVTWEAEAGGMLELRSSHQSEQYNKILFQQQQQKYTINANQ